MVSKQKLSLVPYKNHHLAVVIPAYNEQDCIAQVVTELRALTHNDVCLVDEVVVCNNASTDNTAGLASESGAAVVHEPVLGYGRACLTALNVFMERQAAPPKLVAFVDADCSVKADELVTLLKEIEMGADLVVGSRENELRQKGALSPHQRFGNVLASAMIRHLWKRSITDLGPFRAIRYSRLLELNMQDQRFGWTVEMQVKTFQAGFNYAEVPVTTRPRIGRSKISGTVHGTIGAALGIFGTIFKLHRHEREFLDSLNRASSVSKL